jgi:hypothetical protein
MSRWLGSKLRTARQVFANPDALRQYLCHRWRSLEPTSLRVRWLFPAWWRYHLPVRPLRDRRASGTRTRGGRYLVRVPCAAGIGDQIVTAWSETFLLARDLGLTFAHSPFLPSPHSEGVDWDAFLGFGVDEVQAGNLFRGPGLRTVYLPPLALNTPTDRLALQTLVCDVYPQDSLIFHLGTGLYLNSQLDQAPTMPGVYRDKYWRARRAAPMRTNWSADEIHVAVHVRRGDIASLKDRNAPGWERRWVDASYYIRLLGALRDQLPAQTRLHVYTDGTPLEVRELAVFPRTDFHVREDPRQSFHDLIVADVLVVSSSAFAITAGKISAGLKLVSRTFDAADFRLYVPHTPDWVAVDPDGILPPAAVSAIRGVSVKTDSSPMRGIAGSLQTPGHAPLIAVRAVREPDRLAGPG